MLEKKRKIIGQKKPNENNKVFRWKQKTLNMVYSGPTMCFTGTYMYRLVTQIFRHFHPLYKKNNEHVADVAINNVTLLVVKFEISI